MGLTQLQLLSSHVQVWGQQRVGGVLLFLQLTSDFLSRLSASSPGRPHSRHCQVQGEVAILLS